MLCAANCVYTPHARAVVPHAAAGPLGSARGQECIPMTDSPTRHRHAQRFPNLPYKASPTPKTMSAGMSVQELNARRRRLQGNNGVVSLV